jgi:hypothetical protein
MTLSTDLLQPLVSRVRTDVHWKKAKGSPPFMVKVPLTDEYLNAHMAGGTARGVCPIKAGESTTRVVVLDLDSHKGETSWEEMCAVVESLPFADYGLRPVVFSSSGGKGIHVYLLWDEPQDAYSVRRLLDELLAVPGYINGAGGVSNGQVEIFPKQDSVPLDGFGNMFILPYSGESVPLEPMADYQRMPKDYPVQWPVSAPVPVVAKPEKVVSAPPQGLDSRLVQAVSRIEPNLPYDQWLKVGQAVHHETSGDVNGLLLWDQWSSPGGGYPGFEELEAKWETFGRSSAQPVTAGTIYKMATEAGWIDTPSADDFEVIADTEIPATVNPLRFAVQNALAFSAGKPMGYIVKGILPEADLGVFYGESGSGKSFFTLDMVCAIVRGIPWRGRRVKQGRVVYIIAEGSGGFKNRVNAYVSRHGLTELALDVITVAPNFLEKRDINDVIAAIQASGEGCCLIVVDTWAQVTPGANENSGEDMGKALAHCRRLKQATGAMVLLIHHSGKDSTRGARGWSGLRAAADCEVSIERNEDARVATITKLKDGDDGLQFGFKLVTVPVGHDEDGDPVSSCVVEEAEVNDSVKPNKVRLGANEKDVIRTVRSYEEEKGEWPDRNTLLEALKTLGVRSDNANKVIQKLIEKEILADIDGFISANE